ncbi:N-acetylmuramic acid 6-phosphate etherase [Sphingobacterium suaedae]|uniref:N-acetylmuramic acid 6-phosphate etherase n=1 Tax=Sphingobacterium suaedae TaxID=1686402 RepID=A0ABW5KJF4_9SPHI
MMLQTEQAYKIANLHELSTEEILEGINEADQSVALCISQRLHDIQSVVDVIVTSIRGGGRVFYIGAGTSGRLGVLDSSECPPTFGVDPTLIQGVIAGGDAALRQAVEYAEDDTTAGWLKLQESGITNKDIVIGISASGHTPYVLATLKNAVKNGILTGCIVCNDNSPIQQMSQYPIVIPTGPEIIAGSTRMKAGTAQKMVLNMISTTVMIRLGRVKGNKMVDMELKNNKLYNRAVRMVMEETGCTEIIARQLIEKYKSVRQSIACFQVDCEK